MQYKIVSSEMRWESEATQELEKKVKELFKEGWSLQGGVTVAVKEVGDKNYIIFAQAMVK